MTIDREMYFVKILGRLYDEAALTEEEFLAVIEACTFVADSSLYTGPKHIQVTLQYLISREVEESDGQAG